MRSLKLPLQNPDMRWQALLLYKQDDEIRKATLAGSVSGKSSYNNGNFSSAWGSVNEKRLQIVKIQIALIVYRVFCSKLKMKGNSISISFSGEELMTAY